MTLTSSPVPAVMYVDKLGRKPVLVSGAIGMAACHFIISGIVASYEDDWPNHQGAGWAACVMVWLFVIFFGYSWGPCAWIVIAEIWPMSNRPYGIALGASSNWMNNFIVGQVTPDMLTHLRYGTYIFFGIFTAMGAAFIFFFFPETKGLSLVSHASLQDPCMSRTNDLDRKKWTPSSVPSVPLSARRSVGLRFTGKLVLLISLSALVCTTTAVLRTTTRRAVWRRRSPRSWNTLRLEAVRLGILGGWSATNHCKGGRYLHVPFRLACPSHVSDQAMSASTQYNTTFHYISLLHHHVINPLPHFPLVHLPSSLPLDLVANLDSRPDQLPRSQLHSRPLDPKSLDNLLFLNSLFLDPLGYLLPHARHSRLHRIQPPFFDIELEPRLTNHFSHAFDDALLPLPLSPSIALRQLDVCQAKAFRW